MVNLGIKKQVAAANNVLVRKHTVPIEIKKLYTDVDGVVIDKNTLPATLQKRVPVFLLGEFDRNGGYKIGVKALEPDLNLKYLQTFVDGNGAAIQSIIGFTGLSTIGNYIATGDIVSVWTDDKVNPSYFVWIVVKNTYASIASILGNMDSSQNDRRIGPLCITEILYHTDVETQLRNALFFLHYSNIGTWKQNSIDPLGMFRSPFDVQEGLVRMPIEPLFLDQYFGLVFNMDFDSDVIYFEFKIITI